MYLSKILGETKYRRDVVITNECIGVSQLLGTRARALTLTLTPIVYAYAMVTGIFRITLFCPGGVAGPPNADCYPTAQGLLCGWSDGLEWSTGCAASDASSPLG